MHNRLRLAFAVLTGLLCLPAGCKHDARTVSLKHAAEKVEVVEERWPDGTIQLRRQVVRNPDGTAVNHGAYTRWHPDGRKEYEATFVQGKKNGTATLWHKNGRKWTEEQYVHGKKHGVRRIWDENGVKRKEEQHVEGKPHGTWTLWDKNGKIKWQGSFEHGKPKP